jgi:methylglutaconyl-CoA hydratase
MDLHPEAYVRTERHGAVLQIEFFHPSGNALPGALLRELASQIHGAGLDDSIRVIRLQSGGTRAFCAGAFFKEMEALKTEAEATDFFGNFAHLLQAMRHCPKFIVVRVQGKAVGGGVGIVAAADYAIAASAAEIRLSELSIGIGPFVIGPYVERKIGLSAFSQLAIDAHNWRTAEWALARGLYAEMHSSPEHLEEALQRLTDHLAHSSPQAMKAIKEMLWQGIPDWKALLHQRAATSAGLALKK